MPDRSWTSDHSLIDVTDFTSGELPRRLARVTMRVPLR